MCAGLAVSKKCDGHGAIGGVFFMNAGDGGGRGW